nr:hypothetical protein [Tanacetum cinerariifolium]
FEDIIGLLTNSDESNGVEADVSNMETTITSSPTPTLGIYKDHPKSQIIGPVDTLIQTRNKSKEVKHAMRGSVLGNSIIYTTFVSHIVLGWVIGTSKYWGVLRILMISLRLILLSLSVLITTFYPLCHLDNIVIMARLGFCDYHNMIAILEKYEHNQDFHQIVDFVGASHIRYALTFNPTIHVSHIRQFWSTARIETTEEGTKILATVGGKLRTSSESSIRRNLKLNDEAGISSLPDAELFENLQLMRYNILPNQKFTFQKGQFSHQCKYLIYTIMQCLSPKSIDFNEFSSNIATALVCLATNRVYNFSKMIFDGMFAQITHTQTYVVPFHTRKIFTTLRVNSPSFSGRIIPLFDSMVVPHGEGLGTPTEPHHTPTHEATPSPQHELSSSSLLPIPTESLAYEPASPLGDDSQGEACPTDSGFEADQDRANIAKTSTLPSDSTPRATSLVADEGSMQQKLNELTALCTSLQRQQSEMISKFALQELEINRLKARIKLLQDKDRGVAEQSRDDAPIKGRRLDKGDEAAKRVSDDTKGMATVLTSMDAASILTSGGVQVVPTAAEVATATVSIPTGSGVVSTASPIIPTAALILTTATESTPYIRRKKRIITWQ